MFPFPTSAALDLLTYNLQTKVTNVNRTRRVFEEMVMTDDIQIVGRRLAVLMKKFCSRDGAGDCLKEELGPLLGE
jgi:hypothetical protein